MQVHNLSQLTEQFFAPSITEAQWTGLVEQRQSPVA
jgi:hypothetical protein